MTSPDPQLLSRLRALLHEPAAAPAELLPELASLRAAVAGDDELAHELLALEHRWLQRRVGSQAALADSLAAARRDWLQLRIRGLAAGRPEPAVAFDLADATAEAVLDAPELVAAGRAAWAAAAAAAVDDEAWREEADERLAALLASVEEGGLGRQVALLREHAALLTALGERTGAARFRRQARRLARVADDRELARRLETRLGRRGLAALETTNFVLLLTVLAILVVESAVELPAGTAAVLHWVDGLAGAFFVADFLFEFALHPRRWSWALRNAVTDLLPALPSVVFLFPGVEAAAGVEHAAALRLLRLLRVTWAARYVQALRPLLRAARLLLFLVRGMDGLVRRFAQLLNRDFVFVPAAAEVQRPLSEDTRRDLAFRALQREHELWLALPAPEREALLAIRIDAARATAQRLPPAERLRWRAVAADAEVPIDRAIEHLWALRPQDVGRWLRPDDVRALDRVIRVLAAPPVRWLPIVRSFAVQPLPGSPEERVVALARRVAEWLEAWHGRLLFHADLHGIVTGPQILDRVASAMVKASQRPAVRLLLFGGLFVVVDTLIRDPGWSKKLENYVTTPLLVLGSCCLVLLLLGRWLKRIAGEASDAYRLTGEAQFLPQLERLKLHFEGVDLAFLAARVFGPGALAEAAALRLRDQLRESRTGVPAAPVDGELALDCNRLALLYLHFLDGAPLHHSDVRTTEQLLANQAIENLRTAFQRPGKRDRKRLRRLRLDEGSLFGGPYLWFSFITESVAVEAAKRIDGYNHFCIPLAELGAATPAQRAAMAAWLERRSDPRDGRTLAVAAGSRPSTLCTTEFNALDFVAADPARDRHLAALFGAEVVAVLRRDRRTMVREIFGTRPVHRLSKHERSFNPLRFYQRRLSRGRVLFAPLLLLWRFLRTLGWFVARLRQIVREVFDPELAMQLREAGAAPFAVALRKIHRMKAPGLLEAIRLRLLVDPEYVGAAVPGSRDGVASDRSDFERDLRFLHLHERECVPLRDRAAAVRTNLDSLQAARAWLPEFPPPADAGGRAAAELALAAAWTADRDDVRTLLFAERWRVERLPGLLAEPAARQPFAAVGRWLRGWFVVAPVDRWLAAHGRDLPRGAAGALHRAWRADRHGIRAVLTAWNRLPPGASPAATAIERLRDAWLHGAAFRRDLLVLRAVQSLTVLDIRNHRDLVFRAGDYAAEGEDAALGTVLP